jgi:hypothetical protein
VFESFKRRLDPTMAVALLALFLALGGAGALAAKSKLGKNAVKTKNIKNKAVTGPKIADGAVGASKLAPGTLAASATVHSDSSAGLLSGSSPGTAIVAGTTTGTFCIKLPFDATAGQVTLDGAHGATVSGTTTLFVPNNSSVTCPDPAFQAARVDTFSSGIPLNEGFFATFTK